MTERPTDDLGSDFAQRTKEIMRRKKITREKLSQALNVSTSTLATYLREDDPVSPPLDRAIQISEILREPLEYLCGLNKIREFREKELRSEVVLKNLGNVIRDAKLSVNFQGDKVVLESINDFVVAFLKMIEKKPTIETIESVSKRFQNIKFWKGYMVTDSVYEDFRYNEYLYGDITEEDDCYPDELNELIELRKQHWEQTGGNPTDYLHEERGKK
jgi:transcriptional regulator with XRE-family HTH domain